MSSSFNETVTALSAPCPVRHSFNGGDGFKSTTVHRQGDGGFSHNGLIDLDIWFKNRHGTFLDVYLLFFYSSIYFFLKKVPV